MTVKKSSSVVSAEDKDSSIPVESGHKGIGVDAEIKASNLRRLKRIEGQVRGLQRMVEGDRYCADILTQVSSVQEAIRSVARALMRNHRALGDDLQERTIKGRRHFRCQYCSQLNY
jgi:DNA-binding FrmR family transcriptional regulator